MNLMIVVVIICCLCFQYPIIINISIKENRIRNGKYIKSPGSGIHFVLSSLIVNPSSQTNNDGTHSVPESSISYPNGHLRPSSIHLVSSSRSNENPSGQVVTHVKFENKYPASESHWSQ